MHLGEIIAKERQAQGKTRREVVDKLGISEPYLSEIEHGKRTPYIPKDKSGYLNVRASLYYKILTYGLGKSDEEAENLVLDAQLEELGLLDPNFHMLFLDEIKGQISPKEKYAIIATYEGLRLLRTQNPSPSPSHPPHLSHLSQSHLQEAPPAEE